MLEDLKPEEHERISDLIVSTNAQLDNIAKNHTTAFGPSMLSLMVYLVELIYMSAPTSEDARVVIETAHDIGLQNWADQAAANKHNGSEVELDDQEDEGV